MSGQVDGGGGWGIEKGGKKRGKERDKNKDRKGGLFFNFIATARASLPVTLEEKGGREGPRVATRKRSQNGDRPGQHAGMHTPLSAVVCLLPLVPDVEEGKVITAGAMEVLPCRVGVHRLCGWRTWNDGQ